MGAIQEIHVPDIGDFKGVDVIEVLVSPGDRISAETPLITLESDKASMEVPSPTEGVVKEVKIKVGDKVSEGDLILLLDVGEGSGAAPTAKPESAPAPAEAPSAKPAGGSGVKEVRVPDIGDFKGVEIIDVLVAPGDAISVEAPLIILESDKASMEVPSPAEGVVKEIKVKTGDKVSEGDLILLLTVEGGAEDHHAEEPRRPPAAVTLGPTVQKPASYEERKIPVAPAPVVDEVTFAKVHASPSVRRFARELGVDLGRIGDGSGRKGRITQDDVRNFVKQVMAGGAAPAASAPAAGSGIPPIPAVDFSKFGEIENLPLNKIKRLTGTNLSRSWLNVPHVTHHDEADITDTEAFRKSLGDETKQKGFRVTMLSFLLKASASALREFPTFNASLDPSGESLILKKYVHIGIAVDTPDGLVVPVLRDVDKKSVYALSAEIGEMSAKARERKLKPGEMQGACFTISSLGGIGGTAFTPIVNAPEVSILGVTRSSMKPVWNGKEFTPRLMLPLSLSYDHRVIDGAQAARFVVYLCRVMADVRRLLL
ncbi:MAG: dihydrolipoyllysine-residue acetyltransferase [Gammaproteobacteria bacterium]|nr:dihydrolipoyllysine-residue acetyltransferase [Gammaproteobacteria bacterium]MCP5458524.1 dihydrolipoyllysine-residue acetyltransferase [Gammaproteobacteria bacterium]